MKKLATLLLAAGMVLGSFAGAQAIDWKVRGAWKFEFGLYDGVNFSKDTTASQRTNARKRQYGIGGDTFGAAQRFDTWIEAVASENLSATLRLEIGAVDWGKAYKDANPRSAGGAMGQRGSIIGVRDAYLDWFVPNTELKIRMGIQPISTPGFAFGPSVIAQDVAGITASYKFNDNVSVTALWARPWNDNYATSNTYTTAEYGAPNSLDNVDFFGLLVPLSFDGFKVTPWGMIGAIGPNSFRNASSNAPAGYDFGGYGAATLVGLRPAYAQTHNRRAIPDAGNNNSVKGSQQYATAWWGGLTFDITAADPFRFALDAVYGSVTYADAGYMNRQGWFLTALAEYKLDWGVPGIHFWYGSGDNGNPRDGSEQMPVTHITNGGTSYSSMALYGASYTSISQPLEGWLGTPAAYTGTWGVGVKIRDMSFIEDLKHTIRLNFFGGTNSPQMAKYMRGIKNIGGVRGEYGIHDFNTLGGRGASYLTTQDYGVEVNFDHSYKIYENLELMVELGYMHLWLDQTRSVWGNNSAAAVNARRGVNVTDGLKATMIMQYSF